MNKTLTAINIMFSHLIRNLSNYLFFTGISLIIYYIYIEYGFNKSLLSIGIVFILISMINELNESSNKPQKRY